MMQESGINYMGNNYPDTLTYFKEDYFCQRMVVPEDNLDIDEIVDVYTYPEIVNLKLIDTKTGLSNEGQRLTGNKLIVQLKVRQKITYTTNDKWKTICAIDYEILKNIFICLPKNIGEKNIYDLFKSSRIIVSPFIEHVNVRKIDCRSFNICMLILLDSQIC